MIFQKYIKLTCWKFSCGSYLNKIYEKGDLNPTNYLTMTFFVTTLEFDENFK